MPPSWLRRGQNHARASVWIKLTSSGHGYDPFSDCENQCDNKTVWRKPECGTTPEGQRHARL